MKLTLIQRAFTKICDRKFLVRLKVRYAGYVKCSIQQIVELGKYDEKTNSLVVFFTLGAEADTGDEFLSGGVMSIASLVAESIEFFSHSNTRVFCCTYPGHLPLFKYSKFQSNVRLFQFHLIKRRFRTVNELIIHVPDVLVSDFVCHLSKDKWIRTISKVKINILNQNMLLMPSKCIVDDLKVVFRNTTMTCAHKKYCNVQTRDLFGLPVHLLSTFVSEEQYIFSTFAEKRKLILISNENPDVANRLMQIFHEKLSQYDCQIITGLTYNSYKALISKAMFVITLGEGFDGYFVETFFSGGVTFAVGNNEFFQEKYLSLPCIFDSYADLCELIVHKIINLSDQTVYDDLNTTVRLLLNADYSTTSYKTNIARYYDENYTFP